MKINALRKAIILACSSTIASAMSYSVAAEEEQAAEQEEKIEKSEADDDWF